MAMFILHKIDVKKKVATPNPIPKESPIKRNIEVKADNFFIIAFTVLSFMVCLPIYMIVTL